MLTLETKEVEINGVPYRLGKLPALSAWRSALWIKEVSASSQGAMVKGGDTDAVMTPLGSVAALGNAEAHLAKMLRDPAFFDGVVRPLLGQCMRLNADPPCAVSLEGQNAIYYGNKPQELLLVYQEAVAFNFGPFFAAFNPASRASSGAETDPESPSP